jgi:hypothetical protein
MRPHLYRRNGMWHLLGRKNWLGQDAPFKGFTVRDVWEQWVVWKFTGRDENCG